MEPSNDWTHWCHELRSGLRFHCMNQTLRYALSWNVMIFINPERLAQTLCIYGRWGPDLQLRIFLVENCSKFQRLFWKSSITEIMETVSMTFIKILIVGRASVLLRVIFGVWHAWILWCTILFNGCILTEGLWVHELMLRWIDALLA